MPADALVGRQLTVDALRSAVDAAAVGAGGVVLLAAETVAYAKTRGATAVWGTCWEGEGAPGFWPWIQVIRALAPDCGGASGAVLAAGYTRVRRVAREAAPFNIVLEARP